MSLGLQGLVGVVVDHVGNVQLLLQQDLVTSNDLVTSVSVYVSMLLDVSVSRIFMSYL